MTAGCIKRSSGPSGARSRVPVWRPIAVGEPEKSPRTRPSRTWSSPVSKRAEIGSGRGNMRTPTSTSDPTANRAKPARRGSRSVFM